MKFEDRSVKGPLCAERPRLLDLFEELPSRTLLQIVQHCSPQDKEGVAFMLSLARAASRLQDELTKELETFQLSGRDFTTLLVLFALDPSPVTPSDLAYHVGVNRAALSYTLRKFEASGLLLQKRNPKLVSLTRSGLLLASKALNQFTDRLTAIGHRIPHLDQLAAAEICTSLQGITSGASNP
jgi:DNA-binding MarR family transcriptional regulator